MIAVLPLLIGFVVVLLFPIAPLLIGVVGVIAGLLAMVLGIFFAPPRPVFIQPVVRPRPMTRKRQWLVTACFAVGGVAILLAVFGMWANSSFMQRNFGLLLGSYFLGMAAGTLLTSKRARDDHNCWLAAMNPNPSVPTDRDAAAATLARLQ